MRTPMNLKVNNHNYSYKLFRDLLIRRYQRKDFHGLQRPNVGGQIREMYKDNT